MTMNSVSAECGICLECYDGNERRPLVLPCSHTFCQACLEKLGTENSQFCSNCRREWTGTMIQDLLCCYQLIPAAETTPRQKNPWCTEHGADVLLWCESCSKDICVKCLGLNHKSCNWMPMDEKLKVAARKELNNCVKEVKEMMIMNKETITSLDHLVNELLTCQDEVNEWQKKTEQMLVLSSEMVDESQTSVTITDLQRMVMELKEIKMKLPADSFATVKAIFNQRPRSGLNPESSPMVAIGIDLGIMDSSVAIMQRGVVNIIPNETGARKTPNYVAFTDEGILVGDAAKEIAAFTTENTVFQILEVIGRRFSDPVVQEAIKKFTFKIIENNGLPKIQVNHNGSVKYFTPEEIASMMLRKLKGVAENYLRSRVTHAVISVPAHFNDSQRQATRDAAEMAELNILDIIDEPIAAAIAYGVDKHLTGGRNVVIFDLKKSSLDVSVVSFTEGEFGVIRAVVSDSNIGEEVFCRRLVEHLLKEISTKHKKDISDNRRAMQRLKIASEQAMQDLSYSQKHCILIEGLIRGKDFRSSITRGNFEELGGDIFQQTVDSVQRTLDDSCISKDDIHEVILSGGSSSIPKIRKLLQEFFDEAKLNWTINPDEVVVYGTAIRAASLTTPDTPVV